MNRIPVQSSNLASVGYDVTTITLEVEFKDGSVYQYYDVPEMTYQMLMSADSKGKFLNYQIKGVFRYSRM
jgi:hypothetical protein